MSITLLSDLVQWPGKKSGKSSAGYWLDVVGSVNNHKVAS